MQYPLKFLCDLNRNEKILKFIQKYKKNPNRQTIIKDNEEF